MSELNLEVGKFYYHESEPDEKLIFMGTDDIFNTFVSTERAKSDAPFISYMFTAPIKPWPPEPEQKFKVGDAWESRDGKKYIIEDISSERYLVVRDPDYNRGVYVRYPNGAFFSDGEECYLDLIRPWTDKPKTLQVGWVYEFIDDASRSVLIEAEVDWNDTFRFLGRSTDRLGFHIIHYNKFGESDMYMKLNLESGRPAEEV